MKTFRVRTLYKKSVNVYEEWRHPERKDVINIMENWRWGYWDVTPVDKEEDYRIANYKHVITRRK